MLGGRGQAGNHVWLQDLCCLFDYDDLHRNGLLCLERSKDRLNQQMDGNKMVIVIRQLHRSQATAMHLHTDLRVASSAWQLGCQAGKCYTNAKRRSGA